MFVCWGGGGGGGVVWVLTCRFRGGCLQSCIVGFNSLFTGRCASNLEGGLFTQKYHVLLKENNF